MALSDEYRKYSRSRYRSQVGWSKVAAGNASSAYPSAAAAASASAWFNETNSYFDSLQKILSWDGSTITDRSQIVNPYEVVDASRYRNTREGKKQYDSDLKAVQQIQAAQEASYKEWYDSEEQQAIRQRSAGLNPDLLGVGESSSADASYPSDSPMDSIPTDGEVATNVIGSVASIVTTIASVAALPFQIGQMAATAKGAKVAAEGVSLDNINKFQALAYADIAGQFADATASAAEDFNVDDWFNSTDFTPVLQAYAPSDNPQYRHALERARKQVMKVRGEAYKIGADKEMNQSNFVKYLADPYHDDDVAIQLSYLEPVMQAIEQKRLMMQDYETKLAEIRAKNVQSVEQARSDSEIAEFNYKTDYFNGFDGDEVALYEFMLKKNEAIAKRASSTILDNWHSAYKSNPNTVEGLRYSYLIMNNGQLPWYQYLVAYSLDDSVTTVPVTQPLPQTTVFGTPAFDGGSGYRGVQTPYIPGNFGDVY